MKPKKLVALLVLFIPSVDVHAQVNTVPEGALTYTLPHNQSTFVSVPFTFDPVYSAAVSAVTPNTISVANSSAFTGQLASLTLPASSSPYFVKFLTGAQTGRILLVTANTASSLTLDITDHSSISEPLSGNTDSLSNSSPPFNVAVGDTFEIFPGDTLSTIFGNNVVGSDGTIDYPLLVTGGASPSTADTVGFPTTASAPQLTYYFNTTYSYWVQYGGPTNADGTPVNANSTIIYPYSALAVLVRNSNPDVHLTLMGRVSEVALLQKVTGRTSTYSSTQCGASLTFGQLNLGANWTTSNSVGQADTLGVYQAGQSPQQFNVYYEDASQQWHQYPDTTTSYNNVAIPPGSCLTLLKRSPVSGAGAYLTSSLPYSLN